MNTHDNNEALLRLRLEAEYKLGKLYIAESRKRSDDVQSNIKRLLGGAK